MHALRDKRWRAPTAISFLDTSGISLINAAASSNRSARSTASLSSSCVRTKKESFYFRNYRKARPPALAGLGFRSKEAVGSIGAQLNYMVTSNYIHLLVKDTGPEVIARSMQLIAGRTAQEYDQREGRGERSGNTDIMPHLLRPMSNCIGVWSTSI
jgi:hypothetical protein